MSTNNTNKPATVSKPFALSAEYLAKAGIEISTAENAAADARAALMAHNGGKGYIPQNAAADTVIKVMNYAREELEAGENANRNVCVALASVKMARAYEQANDANGKPYTSMLAFAMDVLPNLSKSSVASFLNVGETIYVPAIQGKFGKASNTFFALPPSTLDAVKANLANENTRADTIEVIKAAAKSGKVTQKLAKNIAKVVRDRNAMVNKPAMSPIELLKAAKEDTSALAKIYGTESASKPGGATKNGGNATSKATGNNDEYNAVKALLLTYIKPAHSTAKTPDGKEMKMTNISMDVATVESFCGALRKIMLSSDDNAARYACRAIAEILEK